LLQVGLNIWSFIRATAWSGGTGKVITKKNEQLMFLNFLQKSPKVKNNGAFSLK
jgi:hypothetical protein